MSTVPFQLKISALYLSCRDIAENWKKRGSPESLMKHSVVSYKLKFAQLYPKIVNSLSPKKTCFSILGKILVAVAWKYKILFNFISFMKIKLFSLHIPPFSGKQTNKQATATTTTK